MKKHSPPLKYQSNKGLYLMFGFIILVFAYLITKEISLNPIITHTIAGLGLVSLFFITFVKPDLVFYIMVAYLPFNKILIGKFLPEVAGINLTNILTILVIIGWAVKSSQEKRPMFSRAALNLPVVIFMALGVTSLIHGSLYFGADYLAAFIIPLKRWLTPVFMYFIALNVVSDKKMFKNTVVIMMLVIFVVALMAIKEYLDVGSGGSLESTRVGGIAQQANMLGGFFVYYMFLFAAFLLMNYKSIKHWFLAIPFVACLIGIQTTFSRGAYVAFAFACLAIAFFRSKMLFMLAVGMLIFCLVNPEVLPPGIRYRLGSTFSQDQIYATGIEDVVDPSAKERIVIWKGAWEIIKDYPLFGVGYGIFGYALSLYAPEVGGFDAHNTYLIIAAEMGIPALLSFLLILGVLFIHTRRLYRISKDKFIKAMALGFLAGLAGLLVVNMFGSRMDSDEVSTYFWILAGLVFRALIIEKNDARRAKIEGRESKSAGRSSKVED